MHFFQRMLPLLQNTEHPPMGHVDVRQPRHVQLLQRPSATSTSIINITSMQVLVELVWKLILCMYSRQPDVFQTFGVCCTSPIIEPSGVTPPVVAARPAPSTMQWPPPIPTHPPDHAAPTHPPGHGISFWNARNFIERLGMQLWTAFFSCRTSYASIRYDSNNNDEESVLDYYVGYQTY